MRKIISLFVGCLSLVVAHTNYAASVSVTNNVPWVDDALPAGAVSGADGGDSWNWVGNNPSPLSGSLSSQSSVSAGSHQHFFYSAGAALQVNPGDTLIANVYLDPNNLPRQVMVQWN